MHLHFIMDCPRQLHISFAFAFDVGAYILFNSMHYLKRCIVLDRISYCVCNYFWLSLFSACYTASFHCIVIVVDLFSCSTFSSLKNMALSVLHFGHCWLIVVCQLMQLMTVNTPHHHPPPYEHLMMSIYMLNPLCQ